MFEKIRGQAMVETVVILFVTILLLFGIIQFGLIYNAKTTLNYAAFEAARSGSLNYADRQAVDFGLARGLAALYTSVEKGDDLFDTAGEVMSAQQRVYDEIQDGRFVCVERLNPTTKAFRAYGQSNATGITSLNGKKLIPNDHLLYRSARIKSGAGVSIQDANLLKIRVTYCYPMYVPFISNVVRSLYGLSATAPPGGVPLVPGTFQRRCLINNRIPIVAQAVIRMQTPPYNDSNFDTNCN